MLYKHFEIIVYIWLLRIQKTSKHTKEDKNCCFVCLCSSSDDCLAEYAHWKVFRCFLTFCKFPKIRLAQNGKEKKRAATSHGRRHSHRPTAAALQPLAPTTTAQPRAVDRGVVEVRPWCLLSPSIFLKSSYSAPPNPFSPPLTSAGGRPVWRLQSAAGGVHACSTERLHGLGSSSSFGGGCARPAASSNDLIAQAQIVPSSRLEFAPILFPPSQPKLPIDALLFLFWKINRSPSWTAIFVPNHFHHICILSFQIDAEAARKAIPGYGSIVDWTTNLVVIWSLEANYRSSAA